MRKIFMCLTFFFLSLNSFANANGVIQKSTTKSFLNVKTKAIATLKAKGLTVMAVVDHHKNAEKVGKELAATTVIIFGNPNLGTPLMQNQRSVAIDLPQKLLIYSEGEKTIIHYNDPFYLQKRHALAKELPQIKKVSQALDAITDSLL